MKCVIKTADFSQKKIDEKRPKEVISSIRSAR